MIDGGPLYTSRSTGRQVAYRSTSVRRRQEEPEPMEPAMSAEQPRQQYRTVEPEQKGVPVQESRARGVWMKGVGIVVAMLLLAAAGWYFLSGQRGIASAIDTEKYQAVFLSNSQVYFGKLTDINGDYMKLTNVFYLERQMTANSGSDDASNAEESANPNDNNFQLLKYSDVLYGSEDAMVISKDDIIRFENLRPDGVVAKAIANRR